MTYDNKHWLLTNIRKSFLAAQPDIALDTENYPKLLVKKASEERSKTKQKMDPNTSASPHADQIEKEAVTALDPYPGVEDDEDDLDMFGSYIRGQEGPHSRQTDTALWLENQELIMRHASKMKVIKFEEPPIMTDEEKIQMYPRKEQSSEEDKNPPRSLLAQQLKYCTDLPQSQFREYIKFDGNGQVGIATKSFKIFMTMLPEELANYPITMCVVVTAKIEELIGFTCYRYSMEHQDVKLGPVNTYGLCIAEDDGEVDDAFPCLDPKQLCSKFDFDCLGLIELKTKMQEEELCLFPDDQFKDFASRSMTMISSASDSLEQFSTFQRKLENRAIASLEEDMLRMEAHLQASDAPHYKVYNVLLVHKMRANTKVSLGICMERIEIEPRNNSSHKFWLKMTPQSYPMETIGCCRIIEHKTNNKTIFRIIYSPSYLVRAVGSSSVSENAVQSPPKFKSREFECEKVMANEISNKITTILEMRMSKCSKDYKAARIKKLQTRRSFSFPKHHRHM